MKNDIQKLAAAAAIGASMFLGGNMAKAEIDYDTSRRLFTLICVIHFGR